jgi:[acyl-carrier-protein] S-malonyltransferase
MLDPRTTAFVFPGGGSQFVGMGQALTQASPAAQQTFAEADDLLGFKLSALCWEGPEAELNDSANFQPALLVCSVAALRALQASLGQFEPASVAGHSLGEISALVAASALSFADGVRLIRRRGEAMKMAGERHPGGMAAVMTSDVPLLAEVCAEASRLTGKVVQIANDNCPGQLVISGDHAALDKVFELAKARGIRRTIKLPVSIGSHSPLMEPAREVFGPAVEATVFAAPRVPVIGNVRAAPLATPDEISAELKIQLVSPVQWTESVRYMLKQGVTTFIELGAKDVLTGLLKRIEAQTTGYAVGTPEAIAQLASPA